MSVDLNGIRISFSCTSIYAPQHWFKAKNTHQNKISAWLFWTVTTLKGVLSPALPAFPGQARHPASRPQPSRDPAARPQGLRRFPSAQLDAPCEKKSNETWQRLGGPDRARKERNTHFHKRANSMAQILISVAAGNKSQISQC